MEKEKFKNGDLCEIVDIGPEDSYFGQKEELIGKKVIFRWYELSINKNTEDGFIGCMLYLVNEFEDAGHYIAKVACFEWVKLKKVV